MKAFPRAMSAFLLFSTLSGCVSEPKRTYPKSFVHTYAELTLLYESQKMEKRETDSAYQVTVRKFFTDRGWKMEEFKQRTEEISADPQEWKMFINDVTTLVDSIKTAQSDR